MRDVHAFRLFTCSLIELSEYSLFQDIQIWCAGDHGKRGSYFNPLEQCGYYTYRQFQNGKFIIFLKKKISFCFS